MTFSNTLIHCSSLGYLFTEPREKAKKDAGELSASAKEHLYKVYIEKYWGRVIEKEHYDWGEWCVSERSSTTSSIIKDFVKQPFIEWFNQVIKTLPEPPKQH